MTEEKHCCCCSGSSDPSSSSKATNDYELAARTFIAGRRDATFERLSTIVSYQSAHAQPGCEEDNKKAASWVRDAFDSLGMGLEMSTRETSDGSLAVVGHRPAQGSMPTVLLYSHYDVVPVGDRGKWNSEPLELTKKDGRYFGRGAADCKGNIVAHLAALETVKKLGDKGLGLRIVIEGSEERGGAGLDDFIDKNPDLVQADAIMIVDSGNFEIGTPTLTSSLRGGALVDIEVTTLKNSVHSGEFGGAAPDAVAALMRTLDSLHDESGLTVIDGVDCSATWGGVTYKPEDFARDAGVLDGVELLGAGKAMPSDLVWARPAVTVIGFDSTPVEHAVNVVGNHARAKLNLRVPAGQDANEVAAKLVEHLKNHTPWGAHVTVNAYDINQPFSGPTTGESVSVLKQAMRDAFGNDVVEAGSGGSIPLTVKLQELVPGAEIVTYGVEEPTCAIHSPNESVSPDEIDKIALSEALFLLRWADKHAQ